ncbi:MAG: aspartate aminotransferase family protein [Hyphomicrobiales bacterium]
MNQFDNHLPTKELQEIDAAHHLHPFTNTKDLNAKGARVIVKAEGIYVWDSEGNKLLDGMAGLWCVNVGYGRDRIADAVAKQMKQLPFYNTFFQTTHPPAAMLAKKLADLLPGDLNHVFFSNGGSDANDTNIRIVRHYWASMGKPDKKVIIARKNAYHGSTMAAASLGGMEYMHAQGGLPIPDITHIDQPYHYGEGGDLSPEAFGLQCAHKLATEIDKLGADNVAAFIAEPIQGAGGVIIPPSTYWPEVERICKERDVLLISDEVICGFGRTGNWFGYETFGFKPDIVTLAKGLSSGYLPIGATVLSDKIAKGFIENGGGFMHGYTYSAHPAACVAALENLAIFEEENIIETLQNETAPYLKQRWEELLDHPLVGEARIVGMVAALELSPNKAKRARFKADAGTFGTICRDHCFDNNLIMRHVRDMMIISPPLIITKAEIDLLIQRAKRALDLTLEAAIAADEM